MQSQQKTPPDAPAFAEVPAPRVPLSSAASVAETQEPSANGVGTRWNKRNALRGLYRAVIWFLWADLALIAVIGGWRLRTYAWEQTESIRFTSDINNAFRIGTDADRIGFLNYYDYCGRLSGTGDAFDVNYAPARLLIATKWARWVGSRLNAPETPSFFADRYFYERARLLGQTYKLCRPLLILNSIMELLASAGMFVLVRHWTRDRSHSATANILAMLAAAALWFNPALIWDAHCWPQWDAWLLPFLIWAMVAASGECWFVAGVLIAAGAMFKGQMLLGAPVLVLWPMWQRRWSAVLRVTIGFFAGAALCTSVWLLRRDGAVVGMALIWVIGIAIALAVAPFHRRISNRYMKYAALSGCAGLLIWPLFTMGLAATGCAVLVAGLVITAVALLPLVWWGCLATASLSAALFLCGPLFGGSTAWFNIGIVSGMHMAPVLHSGPTCNLPAILESQWGWTEMDPVTVVPPGRIANALGAVIAAVDQRFTYTPDLPVEVPLKHVLLTSYFASLVLCGLGAAIQDRRKSPGMLLALVAPWLLMFALMPQMHERYLVWAAALSAVTVALSPGWFALGLLITAVAWSQQAMLMMTRAGQTDSALLRFMNGWTPGVGWALLLASLLFLYGAIAPERSRKRLQSAS